MALPQPEFEDLTLEEVPAPHSMTIEYSDDDKDYLIVENKVPHSYLKMFNEEDKMRSIARSAEKGDLLTIRSVFETNPPKPKLLYPAAYRHLKPAIRAAAINNHVEVVQYLMTKDISPEIGHTMGIIEAAALAKSYPVLQVFRCLGWDINQCIRSKRPPILSKVIIDRDVTQWFLEQGADPNTKCKFDITPTSFAVRDAPMNVIKLLFEHGANATIGNLLHYVAYRFKPDAPAVANLILSKGANINALKFGTDPIAREALHWTGCGTALFEAVTAGHAPLVQFLLSKGADATIPDLQLLTPIQYVRAHLTREGDKAPWLAIATMLTLHAQGHTINPPEMLSNSNPGSDVESKMMKEGDEDSSDEDGYIDVKSENVDSQNGV